MTCSEHYLIFGREHRRAKKRLTYLIDLGNVGAANEFFQLAHLVDACECVDKLGVQHALLHVLRVDKHTQTRRQTRGEEAMVREVD